MTTLNVMKRSDTGKPKTGIHVPKKDYYNDGRTIHLVFSDGFKTLGIMKSGGEESLDKIYLSEKTAEQLKIILGEGII